MTMTKSVIRADAIHEVKTLGQLLGPMFMLAIEKVGHDKLFRNCSMCAHWSDIATYEASSRITRQQGCNLYHAIPPVKIIVCGCDSFEDTDDIPF